MPNCWLQAAWLDANGDWQYPDKYMTSGADTFNWTQISSMMQDRFIDHPQFPPPLKILIFPLQQVGYRLRSPCRGAA